MNAEQLNGILWRLAEGHKEAATVKRLSGLRGALENLANEPQNGDRQNQMREQMNNFVDATSAEKINLFSIREEGLIDDLGLRELVGANLENRVKTAISGQEVLTPRVAFDNVVKIHDALQNKLNRIRDISTGLTELGIDYGKPDAGEVELGMFVPRPAEDLSLEQVLKEGGDLNELVSIGYQVIEGTPHSPPVRYLTSSDYGFLLDVNPAVVAFLVLSLERTLALYNNWLDIRLKHHELKELGASAEHLKPLEDAAEKDRDLKVHAAVLEVIKERSPLDANRQNEIANLVVVKIGVFLKKTSTGSYLDVRVGDDKPNDPAPQEGESEEGSATRAAATEQARLLRNEIRTISQRLHALEKRRPDPAQIPPPVRPSTKQK